MTIDVAGTTVTAADCNGFFTGSISLNVIGGTMPYSYAWTGPNGFVSTDEDLTGLEAGIYTVVVTDANGCEDTASFEIEEPEVLEIDVAGTTTTPADCNGSFTGSIDLAVTGGTMPYTYSWTGPNGFVSTDEDLTGLEAGTYTVVVTDANGCDDTASFEIIEPDPAVGVW
ncbi:MAG: SprB repeat-containing protein, partial [Bacteroidota bacterium]